MTLVIAVITLAIVNIKYPQTNGRNQPKNQIDATKNGFSQFKQEMQIGFRYIQQRPGLLGLLAIYTGLNFIDAITWLSLLPVMILARSGGDEMALASVEGAFGLAGIIGGALVTIWGGPKRKIHGALLGPAFSFILGGCIIAIGQSTTMWVLGAWMAMIFVPILVGCEKSIWQTTVEEKVQGRVFATTNMVRNSMIPVGMLIGGLLADSWFEPAMMPDGQLAPLFGSIVGTGPGAGMAVLFLLTAFMGCALSLSGYLFPAIRNIEDGSGEEKRPSKAVVFNSQPVLN